MAKTKNKKNKLSENINNKKQRNAPKKLNPFEVHVNKEKMKVLGRKLKNDRGLPGISRNKALKKRKETLLEEYKVLGKSNTFIDKRIGERNNSMTEEDRVLARFTAERVKKHKKSIFNLADDEVLTHRGQTLSEIEKFDDPRSDDEDSLNDDNKSGKLESNFVEDAHFGGGLLRKTGPDGAKSHKDLIDQLIAESKKRKAEKQKIKEQTLELTEKLDTEWKDLLPLVNKTSNKTEVEQTVDDYDKVMRELKFEARGIPSDRLKTEDEIAKEEKERLEKLEQDRLKRMKGFIEDEPAIKHKSADDLDDNFEYNLEPDITLSYDKEGISNMELHAELNGQIIKSNVNNDNELVSAKSDEECEQIQSESDETETEAEDNLSDLKEESSDSEDNFYENTKANSKNEQQLLNCNERRIESVQERIKADLQQRKQIMDNARNELPYTFTLPNSYEELHSTLKHYDSNHQSIIIERMIKCNHSSLGEQNRESLGLLFAYLLQYMNDISTNLRTKVSIKKCFDVFNNLVPLMFDLAQLNKESAQKSMLELIKEKQEDLRKKSKKYPDLDVLLYLKLISCLFPTSDFRHAVVTPSIIFIEQMLNCCKVRSKRDISYGLFLVTLILEFTTLSKRFLPAALNYLAGILYMCIPKRSIQIIKVLIPFKIHCNCLVLQDSVKEMETKLYIDDIFDEEIDDSFKIRALYCSVKMLREITENLQLANIPSTYEMLESAYKFLTLIPLDKYPIKVCNEIKTLQKIIEDGELNRKLVYLVIPKAKPKALRLYEPKVVKVFDMKKHKVQSKEKAERDKLLHKLKREKKGALREIRRDQAFLGRLKIKERIKSDIERREKVKKIYAEASVQQSELNAINRKNKRLKR